ncbi:hypothetical protein [Nitrospira sp. Kam-Ns4a]
MPDETATPAPEILQAIRGAERKVERMVRAAEQEAATLLERARAQAATLLAEKRRSLEATTQHRLAHGTKDADREAERLVLEAKVEANELKARGLRRLDEAVELVLRRLLPNW